MKIHHVYYVITMDKNEGYKVEMMDEKKEKKCILYQLKQDIEKENKNTNNSANINDKSRKDKKEETYWFTAAHVHISFCDL